MELTFKLLSESAVMPKRAHAWDAGFDLFCLESFSLLPATPTKIPIGVCVDIPAGYVGIIHDRSSMGAKGVKVLGGVIDAGYHGEISVVLINLTTSPLLFTKHSKIAQLVIYPIAQPNKINLLGINENFLNKTSRGSSGFGSTGT